MRLLFWRRRRMSEKEFLQYVMVATMGQPLELKPPPPAQPPEVKRALQVIEGLVGDERRRRA